MESTVCFNGLQFTIANDGKLMVHEKGSVYSITLTASQKNMLKEWLKDK
jgi:hypothetical protein